jgi:phage repressor protein C with HTH and peptisase S24 domain
MQTLNQQSCKMPPVSFAANVWDMTGLESDSAFVKELCRWAKKAPSALASDAGLAATTITRPFNGTATTRISQPTFEKLRSKFPDFPGWQRETPDQVGMYGPRPDPNEKPDDLVYVREVDISYAMGDGAVIEEYPQTGLIPFNVGFIKGVTRSTTENLIIATGHGESMEPTLLRSDMLMIDTSQRHVGQSDLIWALTYAGGGMIKRLRRVREEGRDRFVILSDNPSVPPMTADVEDVHIVGKLVWVGRRM